MAAPPIPTEESASVAEASKACAMVDFSSWLSDLLNSKSSEMAFLIQEDMKRKLRMELDQCVSSVIAEVTLHLQSHPQSIGLDSSKDGAAPLAAVMPAAVRAPTPQMTSPNKAPEVPRTSPEELAANPPGMSAFCSKTILGKMDEEVPGPHIYNSQLLCDLAGVEKQTTTGPQTRLAHWVRSNQFEGISAGVIFFCTCTMALEMQYNGFEMGFRLNERNFNNPADDIMPGFSTVFHVLELVFNGLFLVELCLRTWVLRLASFRSAWIWFDAILVLFAWIDYAGLVQVGVDPVMLRVLRLARVVRLLKVLKSTRIFETLFLLVRSLQASRGALLWSFVLMWSVQFAAALALCQLLGGYIRDEERDLQTRREVFKYFGTFSYAILTMFEVTLANWVVPCRLLSSNVSEWYGLFFILYRGCFMFAVVKVITAVFVSETSRCTQSDDEIALQKKLRQTEIQAKKLGEVFKELETSNDGFLSWDEFAPLIHDKLIKDWLATMDIDTNDLHRLFDILDDGDAKIGLKEFTDGMSRIKGPAKSMDVLKLMTDLAQMNNKFDNLITMLKKIDDFEESTMILQAKVDMRDPHGEVDKKPGIEEVSCIVAANGRAASAPAAVGNLTATVPAGSSPGARSISPGVLVEEGDMLLWTREDDARVEQALRFGVPKGVRRVSVSSDEELVNGSSQALAAQKFVW